jgi:hypothetical protein
LNALLRAQPFDLRRVDQLDERHDLGLRNRATVGATRHSGDDLFNASRPGIRVADQYFLAARLLGPGWKRPDEEHRTDELVLLVVVDLLHRKALDELVVDECGAESVIAFGQKQPHFFFRVRIEVNEL